MWTSRRGLGTNTGSLIGPVTQGSCQPAWGHLGRCPREVWGVTSGRLGELPQGNLGRCPGKLWGATPAPGWWGGVLGTAHSLKGTIPMTSLYPEQGLYYNPNYLYSHDQADRPKAQGYSNQARKRFFWCHQWQLPHLQMYRQHIHKSTARLLMLHTNRGKLICKRACILDIWVLCVLILPRNWSKPVFCSLHVPMRLAFPCAASHTLHPGLL